MATQRTYKTLTLSLLFIIAITARPTSAQDVLREETSLQFIPADAAFYRTCLRNREQFQTVLHSRAVQRLFEAPQMAKWLAALQARWDDPNRSGLKRWLQEPKNRELASFALDAVSEEVFWYGDASFAELVHLTARVNEAAGSAQLQALRAGQSVADSERAAAQVTLRILADDPPELRIPAMVVGFKVSDPDRAQRQIARLEESLRSLSSNRMPGVERVRRESINSTQFLTWSLDGSLLPWDLVPKSEAERVDPKLRERVKEVLRAKQATVSIGVRGDYLLVSLGENNQHLATLGQGPLLVDRPELAPLLPHAKQPLTTIAYVSETYRQQAAAADRRQLHGSFFFEEFLKHPEAVGQDAKHALDETTRRELAADLQKLATDLADAARSQGATLRFTFLTERGYEGFAYDWSKRRGSDGAQPLTILNHLGGEPLAFAAVRRTLTVEDYDQTIHWLARGVHYFERIGLKQLSEPRQAAYRDLREQAQPWLAQLDRANREYLIPALQDGQRAIVLDASPRQTAELVAEGNENEEPVALESSLPWLELAFVGGLSDADMFKQACREYFLVAENAWSRTQQFMEDVRAEARARVKAPPVPSAPTRGPVSLRPTVQTTEIGEMYSYQMPSEWSRDAHVAPNLALSNDFFAMSYLPDYSQRLLAEQPLRCDGPLADTSRPLAGAAYLNFSGLVDALQPWLERAQEKRFERLAEASRSAEAAPQAQAPQARAPQARAPQTRAPQTRAPQPRAITPAPRASARVPALPPPAQRVAPAKSVVRAQEGETSAPRQVSPQEAKERLRLTLELLRCFRGLECAIYYEDAALVSHYELRFNDVSNNEPTP